MTLYDKIDNIVRELQVKADEIASFEQRVKQLDQREFNLRALETKIDQKEKLQLTREKKLKEQQIDILKANEVLKRKNDDIEKQQILLEEAKRKESEWNEKLKRLEIESRYLEEKSDHFVESMAPRLADIEKQEKLLERQTEIDRVRKEALDRREAKIKQKEQRLQIEIEE